MNELYHYNKNHDRLGRFASSGAAGRAFKAGKDGKASPSEKIARETENSIRSTRDLTRSVNSLRKKPRVDVSHMSDAELRAAINRMNMERQYSDLVSANASKGQKKVEDILGVAGGVAAIGASAAAIATAVYSIKNGKK